MDPDGADGSRLIGDYVLGPRIGSGSFAVVWRSKHRHSGEQVAVKEIHKKQLTHKKVRDNLLKEISILTTITHPNIIRLFETIETQDSIFLVLEYCDGGDLAAYLHRHGKVSEGVAKHFMRQLAAGLKVLCDKHLIHRDLKPQNLLLSADEANPLLKIGDFGFARHLTSQGLADTLCGSPLYMAPEIIQNKKYDAKADLWSVGAILFQLVTGRPPFDGDNHLQLFQNILKSRELMFPGVNLEELQPDCVELCRGLLRQNPAERLSFEEFFNHNFLTEPRLILNVEHSSPLPRMKPVVEQFGGSTDEKLSAVSVKRTELCSGHSLYLSNRKSRSSHSSVHYDVNKLLGGKDPGTFTCKNVIKYIPNNGCDRPSVEDDQNSSDHLRVGNSMESIEKDYVIVSDNFASTESLSSSVESSLRDNSATRFFIFLPKKSDQNIAPGMQTKELAATTVGDAEFPGCYRSDPSVASCATAIPTDVQGKELAATTVGDAEFPGCYRSDPSAASCATAIPREVQGPSILHPASRLRVLHQYAHALSQLAQEKYDEGLFLESISVELVILAIWKEALQVCSSWLASAAEDDSRSILTNDIRTVLDSSGSFLNSEKKLDLSSASSASLWVEQEFVASFDFTEKLSNHLRDMDGNAEMPDPMEIIFRTALRTGKSGAVDELMEKKESAAESYSKAILLLSFIVGEATSLPLRPAFSLTPADKKRVRDYISKLESHQSVTQTGLLSSKQSLASLTN